MTSIPLTGLFALVTLLASGSAPAQDKEKVLREGQVNQQDLIEALTPKRFVVAPAPSSAPQTAPQTAPQAASEIASDEPVGVTEGGASAPRTRGFRPMVKPPAVPVASAATTLAQPARASILVTFVANSAGLTASAKQALDVLASAMKSDKLASVKFIIEGHADPRGSDEVNLKLSQARAEAVRDYVTISHGLAPSRVSAIGKGSSALLNTADPAAPENRRVTIVAQPS